MNSVLVLFISEYERNYASMQTLVTFDGAL